MFQTEEEREQTMSEGTASYDKGAEAHEDALVEFMISLSESGCSVSGLDGPGLDGPLPVRIRVRPVTGTNQVEVMAKTSDDFSILVEDTGRPSDIFAEKMVEHVRDAVERHIAEMIEMREQLDSALDLMRELQQCGGSGA